MTNYNERLGEILYDLDLRVDSGQAYIFDTEEAKQAILSDLISLIGEEVEGLWNEEEWFCERCDWQPTDGTKTCKCNIRNLLRQELREKVKEYCK